MEIWTSGVPAPRGIVHVARDLEERGWDGLNVVDSQNLAADAFVGLAMAASNTERLKLGTGVSNSFTRSAAVLASAIASVQSVSKGRAELGIGRGDSALAHLGRAPARLAQFERYVGHLQAYLSGEPVAFEELIDMPFESAPAVSTLELAEAPDASQIGWIAKSQQGLGKVPVEVAATGPKVIQIAARLADRVMFALGARPDRIQWGMNIARQARAEAGLDPDAVLFGSYVPCSCHPDIGTARDMVRGGLTVAARFAIMHGKTHGPLSDDNRAVMEKLRNAYDMHNHTRGDSAQAAVLTPRFIDEYAVVGKPDRVVDRLRELKELGLDKVVLNGSWRNADPSVGTVCKQLLEDEVLPAVRG
ncbi:MAG: LLM class flavin-dependent oxidoreductase [Pseudomonadota bacterium]